MYLLTYLLIYWFTCVYNYLLIYFQIDWLRCGHWSVSS